MQTVGARTAATGFAPGAHACWSYGSDDEHRDVLAAFYAEGLAAGERCLYFGRRYGVDVIASYLEDAGLRAGEYIDRGQMVFVDAEAAYAPGGAFDPDAMRAAFGAATAQARADGFTGLRASGEMAWLLPGVVDPQAYAAYELTCDAVVAAAGMRGLCGYDTRDLAPEHAALFEAVHLHRVRGRPAESPPFSVCRIDEGRFQIAGEVDFAWEDVLLSALEAAAAVDESDVTLDLSALGFVDVAGLRVLARFAAALGSRRRTLTLSRMTPFTRRVWGLTGFEARGVIVAR